MRKLSQTSGLGTSVRDPVGWMFFVLLCLTNGSTFLAMRVAVGPGGGFTPLWMAATRFTVGGTLFLGVLALLGVRVRPPGRSFVYVVLSGALLCGGGTGLAAIAAQRAGSSLVALSFALAPIWAALLESVISRRLPSLLGMVAMVLGVGGVGLLVSPASNALPTNATTLAALLLGPISYAAGTLVAKRAVDVDLWVTITWQMLSGAAVVWIALMLIGEPVPTPTAVAWGAWAYLTVVTSLLGFTSFIIALRRLPATVFMSHFWALPVVATILGVLVVHESLNQTAYLAAGLIIMGLVTLVSASARSTRSVAANRELPSNASADSPLPAATADGGPASGTGCGRRVPIPSAQSFRQAVRRALSVWAS